MRILHANLHKLSTNWSKNSAICTKRSEDPQSKGAGFNEPQGGYMSRDPGIGDASLAPGSWRLLTNLLTCRCRGRCANRPTALEYYSRELITFLGVKGQDLPPRLTESLREGLFARTAAEPQAVTESNEVQYLRDEPVTTFGGPAGAVSPQSR